MSFCISLFRLRVQRYGLFLIYAIGGGGFFENI